MHKKSEQKYALRWTCFFSVVSEVCRFQDDEDAVLFMIYMTII